MITIRKDKMAVAAKAARDLADAKSKAIASVNEWAGKTRSLYITELPGQEMIYLAKQTEATAYLASRPADLTDYPFLAAEVGVTAPTAYELAQLWLNMAALWKGAAAQIENLRLTQIAQIESAASLSELTQEPSA